MVVGFQWDEGNARKNADKHDVSQAEAGQVFFNEPLLLVEDIKHSDIEHRLHALGKTDIGSFLHVTFMLRQKGSLMRVISARDMSRKERRYFEHETGKKKPIKLRHGLRTKPKSAAFGKRMIPPITSTGAVLSACGFQI